MKKMNHIAVILLTIILCSCEKFMEPAMDSYMRDWQIEQSRDNFRGLLYNTYLGLPTRINFVFEAATDNAVTNIDNTSSSRAARGGISYINNPLDNINQNGLNDTYWRYNYMHINRINYFLEKMTYDESKNPPTPVIFEFEEIPNKEWFWLLMGEAHFLRAWYQFEQLQKYGGVTPDGQVYGFPVITKYLTVNDELDLPRNTYQACVDQIVTDCEEAVKYLSLNYTQADAPIWDEGVMGSGRASGVAALALKARTLLYAASPAYNIENDVEKWKKAAQAAQEVIDVLGFDDLMTYAAYFDINNLNNNAYNNRDILFRGTITDAIRTYETENFPPRVSGGNGTYNPTQNLVDAFPMCDGYPRNQSPDYPYTEDNMYDNRDPRLAQFILYTNHPVTGWGGLANPNTIQTQPGGNDAFGTNVNATRTGYYLRKWLNGSVRLTGTLVNTRIAPVLIGRAELYLNFAEAAFHATGNPDDATYGYTAREALAKVRNRALGNDNDKYLPVVTNNEFVEVLRNERRIELCFEGHRFWDLRRWSAGINDLTAINTSVYGLYSSTPVETRQYNSPYMPLPYGEILKTNNLVNNAGW